MKRLIQILTGLSTCIFIICLSVVLTLNCTALYDSDIDRYDLTEQTGMTREEIKANYKAMIDYNNLSGPNTLEFPTLPMSEGGRIHFEEVRRIFHAIEYCTIIFGIISAVLIIFLEIKRLRQYRLWTTIFTVALPAICGIYAALAWDSLFVTFHHLMFNNDFWIFDAATDPVITILPDGYFLHCLIMIAAIAFACAALSLILYIYDKKRISKKAYNANHSK